MRTDTTILIQAMRHLANDIQSEDGVANAAIAEASYRLEELQSINAKLLDALKNLYYVPNDCPCLVRQDYASAYIRAMEAIAEAEENT